jgi:hypothetical protein
VEAILHAVGPENVIFEAPQRDQRRGCCVTWART